MKSEFTQQQQKALWEIFGSTDAYCTMYVVAV